MTKIVGGQGERVRSVQTLRELATGSLEKGVQKSECLSLAGILANFVGDLPNFFGSCLFSSANDDKLLPPGPQPTFCTAYVFITITLKQQIVIRKYECGIV